MDTLNRRKVAVGVIGLALVSTGLSWKSSRDAGKAQDCLTSYAVESAKVSRVRAAATGERDVAIDDVINAFDEVLAGVADLTLKPSADPVRSRDRYRKLLADYKAESREYRAASAKVKAERAKNPLPEPPERCSDAG